MKKQHPSPEILSLNLDDLDVEEMERRLELASAWPHPGGVERCFLNASCGDNSGGCGINLGCASNTAGCIIHRTRP